jgi:hypothetical protein
VPLSRDEGWGRLAKANQQLAYALLTTVAALYLGSQAGIISAAPVPVAQVAPLLDPDARAQVLMAAEGIQANNRLLQDLHSGISPRDPNLVPQWAAMRTAMDRQLALTSELVAVLKRNADASYTLSRALDANVECLRPLTPSVRSIPKQRDATLWHRILGWFGRDAGA